MKPASELPVYLRFNVPAARSPARRTRVANAVTAALDGCAANPTALTWPDKYIELLGHSANRTASKNEANSSCHHTETARKRTTTISR